MSGDLASDLAKLENAARAMRSVRIKTVTAGDHDGAEIGNDLQEALGSDSLFLEVYGMVQEADALLNSYSDLMLRAIQRVEELRTNIMGRLG